MLLLIDENVPESVTDFLRARGHDVRLVREVLPAGTADPILARIGDELEAIVVTWDKDFRRVISRVPFGSRAAFRRLGRISFRCNEARGRARIEELIEWIEFEYAQVQKRRDKRLIVEIGDNSFRVIR